ncbi:hypothetical protein H0H92_014677 [Tricholoma furcatifolium]|nr:hypothetical protein H0H92_014677 [Tricholoma furcatifolium]
MFYSPVPVLVLLALLAAAFSLVPNPHAQAVVHTLLVATIAASILHLQKLAHVRARLLFVPVFLLLCATIFAIPSRLASFAPVLSLLFNLITLATTIHLIYTRKRRHPSAFLISLNPAPPSDPESAGTKLPYSPQSSSLPASHATPLAPAGINDKTCLFLLFFAQVAYTLATVFRIPVAFITHETTLPSLFTSLATHQQSLTPATIFRILDAVFTTISLAVVLGAYVYHHRINRGRTSSSAPRRPRRLVPNSIQIPLFRSSSATTSSPASSPALGSQSSSKKSKSKFCKSKSLSLPQSKSSKHKRALPSASSSFFSPHPKRTPLCKQGPGQQSLASPTFGYDSERDDDLGLHLGFHSFHHTHDHENESDIGEETLIGFPDSNDDEYCPSPTSTAPCLPRVSTASSLRYSTYKPSTNSWYRHHSSETPESDPICEYGAGVGSGFVPFPFPVPVSIPMPRPRLPSPPPTAVTTTATSRARTTSTSIRTRTHTRTQTRARASSTPAPGSVTHASTSIPIPAIFRERLVNLNLNLNLNLKGKGKDCARTCSWADDAEPSTPTSTRANLPAPTYASPPPAYTYTPPYPITSSHPYPSSHYGIAGTSMYAHSLAGSLSLTDLRASASGSDLDLDAISLLNLRGSLSGVGVELEGREGDCTDLRDPFAPPPPSPVPVIPMATNTGHGGRGVHAHAGARTRAHTFTSSSSSRMSSASTGSHGAGAPSNLRTSTFSATSTSTPSGSNLPPSAFKRWDPASNSHPHSTSTPTSNSVGGLGLGPRRRRSHGESESVGFERPPVARAMSEWGRLPLPLPLPPPAPLPLPLPCPVTVPFPTTTKLKPKPLKTNLKPKLKLAPRPRAASERAVPIASVGKQRKGEDGHGAGKGERVEALGLEDAMLAQRLLDELELSAGSSY